MKTRLAIIIAILIGLVKGYAQERLNINVNDSVRLTTPPYRGTIQWQFSNDGSQWQDLPGATANGHRVKITTLPSYFRGKISEGECDDLFTTTLQVGARWSDPLTWGGTKPKAGDVVTISGTQSIILDEDTPALGGLTIDGTLIFDRKNLTLTSKWIVVHGALRIGTETQPFTHKATLILNGDNVNESIMGMGTRGVIVMGGTLDIHGVSPQPVWTRIKAHAPAGTSALSLQVTPNWVVGDQIAIAPTDYFLAGNGNAITQTAAITSISASNITFDTPLSSHRWGLLQYATPTGMSLSAENRIAPPAADTETRKTPTVLDERAEVGNLSRNVVIQAPDDALWTSQGFGVHVMIMGQGSMARVEGVEIRRGGQRGRLARYPFHWHQLSYEGSATTSDATGHYFRNSSINVSANRGIVVHGTNGTTIQNNVIYNVRGHAVFTEDAVERRNVFDGNLILHVRNSTQPLKVHEGGNGNERGSSGFWISNPDNTVINNTAADCHTNGFWLPFPNKTFGLNSSVKDVRDGLPLNPSRLQFGKFDNNTSHSNGLEGIMLDEVEVDEAGNTFPHQYLSTTTGRNPEWPFSTLRRFQISNCSIWKNGDNGFWDRAAWPDNFGLVSADNCGRFFAGSGADGVIERSLVVGTSLNHMMNGTGRPAYADFSAGYSSSDPVAFATYHSSFDIRDNIVINFPGVAQIRSGAFSTDDYYIRPVERGQLRNTRNVLINCHPGVRLTAQFNWFALASALWDPHGVWGPSGNYLVYDLPFLTHGKAKTEINPGTSLSGSVSVPGPFYGFEGFVLHGVGDTPPKNQPYFDLMAIHVRRLDNNLNELATWAVPAPPNPQALLQHMRHFATVPESIYELTFPGESALPTDFQMNVENMLTTADTQVIGIAYSGTLNPVVRMISYATPFNYQAVGSLNDVVASAGETFWQDKANNRVWVKLRGGRWQYWTNDPNVSVPTSDELLYETTVLRIFQP